MTDTVPGATQGLTSRGTTSAARLAAGWVSPRRDTARRYQATLVESGPTLNGWTLPAEVLGAAREMFRGAPCLVDHPDLFSFPSLRNLAGTFEAPAFDGRALTATLRLAEGPAGALLDALLAAWLAELEEGLDVAPVGLSAFLSVRWDADTEDPTAAAICRVWSVDAVLHPAAGGRVERVLLSALARRDVDTHDVWSARRPPVVGTLGVSENAFEAPSAHLPTYPVPGGIPMPSDPIRHEPTSAGPLGVSESAFEPALQSPAPAPAAAPTPVEPSPEPLPAISSGIDLASIEAQLAALGQQVETLTAALSVQEEARTVTGMGTPPVLRGGHTGLDQLELAVDAMLEGTRPPAGIAPLTGIRELYHLLSGDYEMTGVYQPDRVYLANVTTSTMAGMVANRLNKRVVNAFQQYPQWWTPIVTEEDFSTLQDIRWITLGGIGELPTVAEGAAYTELTWDDLTQTATFYKKGGYLGLTIEAIDKDDTGRLRSAPRALAQAAWLTLSKAVSAIFTSNSGVGPNVYYDDSNTRALFHATNANLGTTALSWSAWNTTRQAMRDQTEVHSGEALGALTAPRFLLVPGELEVTALQILASEGEPGTADNDVNPWAAGMGLDARLQNAQRRVIVIDLWTDANDWAAVADPNLYPTIGIGYRYGRAPEIFSVASPTAGLMFTNDTMPIKVRFVFATGPMDYRGLYKHNV